MRVFCYALTGALLNAATASDAATKNSTGCSGEANITNKKNKRLIASIFRRSKSLTCEGRNETVTKFRVICIV